MTNITVSGQAETFLANLLVDQNTENLAIQIEVVAGGSPNAEIGMSFFEMHPAARCREDSERRPMV